MICAIHQIFHSQCTAKLLKICWIRQNIPQDLLHSNLLKHYHIRYDRCQDTVDIRGSLDPCVSHVKT